MRRNIRWKHKCSNQVHEGPRGFWNSPKTLGFQASMVRTSLFKLSWLAVRQLCSSDWTTLYIYIYRYMYIYIYTFIQWFTFLIQLFICIIHCACTHVYIYIYHADTYAWSILDSFQKGYPLAGKPMLKQLQLPNTGWLTGVESNLAIRNRHI